MKKLKQRPIMFPSTVNDVLDVEYPLPKEEHRVVTTFPPGGEREFYGEKVTNPQLN